MNQQENIIEEAYKNGVYVGRSNTIKKIRKILVHYYPDNVIAQILREIDHWKESKNENIS